MKLRLALLAIIISFSLPHQALIAQPGPPPADLMKFSARVHVKVSAPEPIKNAVMTLIDKELQALGDVVASEQNPNYRLTIMAIPNRTREENFGFTFSVLITRPLDVNFLAPLLRSDKLEEKERGLLIYLSNKYEMIEKQSMLTSSNENIPQTCHEIVRGFDADLIEKDRKLWRTLWGPMLKSPENAPAGAQPKE